MLLNPANLNSTETVCIIRLWISASVLLLTIYMLAYCTNPIALRVTPFWPSTPPPIHHGASAWLIVSPETPPAPLLYLFIRLHLTVITFVTFIHFFFLQLSYVLHHCSLFVVASPPPQFTTNPKMLILISILKVRTQTHHWLIIRVLCLPSVGVFGAVCCR